MAGELGEDLLLLVEHEPVVTLGRGTRPAQPAARRRPSSSGAASRWSRSSAAGDVTYHGPGQLVGYPILDFSEHREDLHWYLRQLEAALIAALGTLGVTAERNPGLTGVWTGGRKIASIGIHVKQWVTFHGFALNVSDRPAWLRPHRAVRDRRCRDDQRRGGAGPVATTRRSGTRRRDAVVAAFGRRSGTRRWSRSRASRLNRLPVPGQRATPSCHRGASSR